MGLNSFILIVIIITMRYYPCRELSLDNIRKQLDHMTLEVRDETWLLSQNGYYKYVKDKLMIYKLNLYNNDHKLEKYVKDIDFIVSNNTWKKIEERYNIPPLSIKIKAKVYIFSPNSRSTFRFIVERYDTGKIDYYFTSPESFENHSLKEDICSFLIALT